MESTGEIAWFRNEIWRSLIQPREFARDLAREHYGIAGVLVALIAGFGLSIGIDLLVLASKDVPVTTFGPRLLLDGLLLGVRVTVTAAVVAWISTGAVRLLRRRGGSLDQLFTALTFGLAPLILAPVAGVLTIVVASPLMLTLAAGLVLALVVRVLVGLALNIRSILPAQVAIVSFLIVLVLGGLVLNDQVSRMRFLAYSIAPQLVPVFTVAPATGQRYTLDRFELTVPPGWKQASGGAAGEIARFESANATMVVLRARGAALDTADAYANAVATPQRVGVNERWDRRDVVRINDTVVVDDSYGGVYEGRNVVWRQFTAVPGVVGLALLYHIVEPPDREASLAEAASIAASWRLTGR